MKTESKNTLLVFALILFLVQIGGVACSQPGRRDEAGQLVSELHMLIREKRAEGYDVSKAIELERRAREAARSGDREEGLRLLREALRALNEPAPAGRKETFASSDTGTFNRRKASERTKTVELSIPAKEVVYTVAIPKSEYPTGGRIKNFADAFETRTLKVVDGKLTLRLDDRPVFLEVGSEDREGTSLTDDADSPFGILMDVPRYSKELSELNVKWVRLSGLDGMVWAVVEPEKGRFDFKKLDRTIQDFYRKGFNLFITVSSFNVWDQYGPGAVFDRKNKPTHKLPKDLKAYSNFLQKAVERYDGDGIDDAPGSPVVRYWQIQNEPDFFWKDTPENYAKLLKVSYQAIKKADPQAQVVIGGIGGLNKKNGYNFYASTVRHLDRIKDEKNERFFDVFDMHWMSTARGYKRFLNKRQGVHLGEFIDKIRNLLDQHGYADARIFITEASTFSGCPERRGGKSGFCQSEEEQATGLLKFFIYPFSKGVSKVFWVSLHEWHNFGGRSGGVFDHVGLINNPANSGKKGKKPAFYTYKLLIEKTEGADWKTLQKINVGERDVHVYRVMKNGQQFYIAWWDNF